MIKHILRKAVFFEYKALKSLGERMVLNKLFKTLHNRFSPKYGEITRETFEEWFDLNKNIFEEVKPNYSDFNGLISYYEETNPETGEIKLEVTKHGIKACILSETRQPKDFKDNELSVLYEAKLQKYKNIPELWILKVIILDESDKIIDKEELMQYGEILHSIDRVANLKSEDKDELLNNLSKLGKTWFRKIPKYLGAGADGAAFDIGEGKVLKIYKSLNAYTEAIKTINTLHKNKILATNEVMIYDVGILCKLRASYITLYYMIIEKMNIVLDNLPDYISEENKKKNPDKIFFRELNMLITKNFYRYVDMDLYKKVFNLVIQNKLNLNSYLSQRQNVKDHLIKDIQKTKNELYNLVIKDNFIKEMIPIITEKYNLRADKTKSGNIYWLDNFITEICYKLYTNRKDIHLGNVGITNYGLLRVFDPVI